MQIDRDVPQGQGENGSPVTNYARCHAGIISTLMVFSSLPLLASAQPEPTNSARTIARDSLVYFRDVIVRHHAEEETQLFVNVLAQATPGAEKSRVHALVQALTQEHRKIEHIWAQMVPALECIAAGTPAYLPPEQVETLVLDYGAHAAFEEADFLPMCRTILQRSILLLRAEDLVHPVLPSARTE